MPGFFDNFNLDSLRSLFPDNDKTIRIAVTGATASGKTYLLKDMLGALRRFGATITSHSNRQYADFQQLEMLVDQPINKTTVYPARQRNIYAAKVRIGASEREMMVVDTPGEAFREDTLNLFAYIIKALFDCKQKIFKVRTWKRSGYPDVFTVFVKTNAEVENVEILTPEQYNQQQYSRYFDNDNEYKHLRDRGYEQSGNIETINGKKFLERFLTFDIDTALNAIYNAWDLLDIDDYIARGVQVATTRQSSPRNVFKQDPNPFFFIYYTTMATDIVLCDLMAKPRTQGVTITADANANRSFDNIVRALERLLDGRMDEKRWYMVLKGIDSVMTNTPSYQPFKKAYTGVGRNSDYVYSLLALAFSESVLGDATRIPGNEEIDDDGDEKKQPNAGFAHLLTEKAIPHSATTADVLEDYNEDKCKGYFRLMSSVVMSGRLQSAKLDENGKPIQGTGTVAPNSLKSHVSHRLSKFGQLSSARPSSESHFAKWSIMPHVFLVGHPIDNDFNIHGLRPNHSDAKFFDEDFDPNNRLAFGTTQLMADLLQRNDMELPAVASGYGYILSYLYGNY